MSKAKIQPDNTHKQSAHEVRSMHNHIWRRISAYVIDWTLSGILIGFPGVVIFNLLCGTHELFTSLYVFPAKGLSVGWSYVVCATSLMIFLVYFVVIPLKIWRGQTLGKRIFRLRIEHQDNKDLDLRTMLMRQMLGLLLVEGISTLAGTYLRQALTLLIGSYVELPLLAVAYVITMISAVLVFVSKKGLALHDLLARTCVVAAD